ncbi:hypothetical protein BN1723_000526 [Verticillium longisporum]|uniref:Uncharacterized protein n=1 Tax=Verticillium longisporum TaxID=100787 RepID=A0A0G4M5P0_VERLO|nr:hypothetical protein BN1723_000526 [Verticillium longisporum]
MTLLQPSCKTLKHTRQRSVLPAPSQSSLIVLLSYYISCRRKDGNLYRTIFLFRTSHRLLSTARRSTTPTENGISAKEAAPRQPRADRDIEQLKAQRVIDLETAKAQLFAYSDSMQEEVVARERLRRTQSIAKKTA